MCDLLCVVLLDLVEAQESILGLELVFQRVEKDLILIHFGLALFEHRVELFCALVFLAGSQKRFSRRLI